MSYDIYLDDDGNECAPPAPDTMPSSITEHMAALDLEYEWRAERDDAWTYTEVMR